MEFITDNWEWYVSGALALLFFGAGGTKVLAIEFHRNHFEGWGYPRWFLYAVGIVEVAGAAALLVPDVALLAAAGLGATMAGAVYTHIRYDKFQDGIPAIVFLALLVVVGIARWDRFFDLFDAA